jgi:hypothetical protein
MGTRFADPLDANEAATVVQRGPPGLDSSSNAYVERSTKPCVAPCLPMMAPHLAPATRLKPAIFQPFRSITWHRLDDRQASWPG